jgi:hypothetical protein
MPPSKENYTNLSGKVFQKRYVQPYGSTNGSVSSRLIFSMKTKHGLKVIKVVNTKESSKEEIDVLIKEGTSVIVQIPESGLKKRAVSVMVPQIHPAMKKPVRKINSQPRQKPKTGMKVQKPKKEVKTPKPQPTVKGKKKS